MPTNDFATAAWRDQFLRPAQWGVCGSCRQLGQGNTCPAHRGQPQKQFGPIGDEPDFEAMAEQRAEARDHVFARRVA